MLGHGENEFSIMSIVSTCGLVRVFLLGSFTSVGSSFKPSYYSLPIYPGALNIQDLLNNKTERKRRLINPQQDKARHEKWRNKMRATVQ